MSTTASQITSLTIVYSTLYSGADQRKHQSSASLALVRGNHRWPVNSPHKGPVTCDDVIKGNTFRVNDPLCGEFTGHRWIPPAEASDAELWCFLWSALEHMVEYTIVNWDAIVLIMTSGYCNSAFRPSEPHSHLTAVTNRREVGNRFAALYSRIWGCEFGANFTAVCHHSLMERTKSPHLVYNQLISP